MKLLKSTLLLTVAAIMAVGCQEGLRISQTETSANVGYLSLSALSVELISDHKPTDGSLSRAEAAQIDIASFDCAIYNQSGDTLIQSFKYGERPAEAIELEAGRYIFTMSSGQMVGAAFESPVYGLTEPFTIVRKQTTELNNLVCTLQNIQATVSYSVDLRESLGDDTTTTLTVGSSSLVYAIDESRSGYFKAEKALNDINVLVKGLYSQDGKTPAEFEFTTTIKDVKAGQHSDIQLYIEHSSQGNIALNVTIDGWVVDQSVVFDLATLISEDVMADDTDKPTVTLVDGDINTPITLFASDFDEAGNCAKNIVVDIATKAPIASLLVDISSTNPTMVSSLAQYGLSSTIDLCNAGGATGALKLMGLPVNNQVLGQNEVSYNITAQMRLLREFVGTHTFTATITDENGASTTAALAISIEGKQSGPAIVWQGYDIDRRYTVVPGMTVDIVVTAAASIKDFSVQIQSQVLTPAQLSNVGLCDILNLANPTNSYSTVDANFDASNIAEALTGLGFPIGEAVKGQTVVEFSITQFLELLTLTGAGMHDFIMTVTDNDGNTTVKTLMIETVK